MATIEEMQSKMTIFYSKGSGKIRAICTGIQDMSFFNEDKDEFAIIWDYIVVPLDQYVINNWQNFRINIETKQLEIKPETIPQYPIASTQ